MCKLPFKASRLVKGELQWCLAAAAADDDDDDDGDDDGDDDDVQCV